MKRPLSKLPGTDGARALLVLAALATLLLGAAHRALGETWEPFAVQEGSKAQWYYDKEGVTMVGNVADASVLIAERDGGHSSAELRIWCDMKFYAIMAGQEYDKDDNVLLDFRNEKENWLSIGEGTCIEALCRTICPKAVPLPELF